MAEDPPADRDSPVGEPVVRGDPDLLGERAEAVSFDPEDPESLAAAADAVLRGAAAAAALVRGEGSYTAAAERAGEDVTVGFVRKWARVHDLPYAVRRHVAVGDIPPTAAKHVARVDGDARYLLAWAVLDDDLTVREVRSVASAVNDGADAVAALADHGADVGTLAVDLPPAAYVELRRRAALGEGDPGDVVRAALEEHFERTPGPEPTRD